MMDFDAKWRYLVSSNPNIANRKGGNCFVNMNFAVIFCCTLSIEGFVKPQIWQMTTALCLMCPSKSTGFDSFLLLLKSDKPNPSEAQNMSKVSYHYNWYTPLMKRYNLPRGGQNQEWSPYIPWRLDDYIVPGCGRLAGGQFRYCFVCLTSLTTGLVQVKWLSYLRHTSGLRSSSWGLVYLKAE